MRKLFLIFLSLCLFTLQAIPPVLAQSVESADKTAALREPEHFSALTGTKGIGRWQATPFGRIRLVSAHSGTNNLTQMWFAVQIEPAAGAVIHTPTVKLSKASNLQHFQFYYPLMEEKPMQGFAYDRLMFLPFSANVISPASAARVTVLFTSDYCVDTKCAAYETPLSLDILAGYDYFTPLTNYIHAMLAAVPDEDEAGKLDFALIQDGVLWARIHNTDCQDLQVLLLNTERHIISAAQEQAFCQKGEALFIFRAPQLKAGDLLRLIAITPRHVIEAKQNIIQKPLPSMSFMADPQKSAGVLAYLFFLLISGVWFVILNTHYVNEKHAKELLNKQIAGVFCGVLLGWLLCVFFPFERVFQSLLWLLFGFGLFLYLALSQYKLSSLTVGLLTAILPYSILLDAFGLSPITGALAWFSFYSKLAFVVALPLIILRIFPYAAVKFSRHSTSLPQQILRVPMWFGFFLYFYALMLLML